MEKDLKIYDITKKHVRVLTDDHQCNIRKEKKLPGRGENNEQYTYNRYKQK